MGGWLPLSHFWWSSTLPVLAGTDPPFPWWHLRIGVSVLSRSWNARPTT